jgi:hypothetical protein
MGLEHLFVCGKDGLTILDIINCCSASRVEKIERGSTTYFTLLGVMYRGDWEV